MYRNFFKRALDIVCSLIFIICFWWLYIVVAILVRQKLGSPVIFKQKRPGLNGKVFTMYKFRSMTDARDKDGNILSDEERLNGKKNVLSDEQRLTKFGKILRASSLDELPEFINILKGDMSLIGPRPLAVKYLSYYTEQEKHRHDVRPGISGWAQVNGRNTLTWEDRFKYDLYYVKNLSLLLDMKIILKTIMVVVRHNDVAQGTQKEKEFDVVRREEIEKMKEEKK